MIQDRYDRTLTIAFRCQLVLRVALYTVLDLFFQSSETYVYLIHLDTPLVRSNGVKVQHYLGSTDNLKRRLQQHRRKKKVGGSPLLREANKRGITWTVVKVWQASRAFEMYLKKQKHSKRYCPICNEPEESIPF